jgi:uncharacterized protein
MSAEDNVRVVEQAYNNFKTGDIAALLDLMADDVTWQLPSVADSPFTGKRQGRASVGEFFALVAAEQDVRVFEPHEFVAQGDKVVALGHYEWLVKRDGRVFASDFAHVFTVRAGKITGFHEYFDTAVAAEAYRRA